MAFGLFQVFGRSNNAYPGLRLSKQGSIRVLRRRKAASDRIECRLKTIETTSYDKVGYFALSYRWGDWENPKIIYCNGVAFNIQRSLYSALLHIWDRYPDMQIWVDAICIDQSDVEERSSQVRMMGTIYQQALGVMIWLGEVDDFTDLAWTALAATSHWSESQASHSLKDNLARIGPVDTIWFSLHRLAKREWFYRAWTFQELFLAQHAEVICPGYRMDWNSFHGALETISNTLREDAFPTSIDALRAKKSIPRLLRSVEKLWLPDRSATLTDLLVKTVHRSCDDPRDRIYSLFGVLNRRAGPWMRSMIEVDYRMSPERLYTMVAHDLVCRAEWTEPGRSASLPCDLHILHGAGLDAQHRRHMLHKDLKVNARPGRALPTWVIDWTDSEATAAWADKTYVRRQEWRPIIRTDGIDPRATVTQHQPGAQENELLISGMVIARLVPPKHPFPSNKGRSSQSTILDLEELPRCAYHDKVITSHHYNTDILSSQDRTEWTTNTPNGNQKQPPEEAHGELYGSASIIRALSRHDREACECSRAPYFHTVMATIPALVVSTAFPPLAIYLFLWVFWVAYKDNIIESGKPSRKFCIEIKASGGIRAKAAAGDWIVSVAGEQGLFLLKPTRNGKFELVRGLLRQVDDKGSWDVFRVDAERRRTHDWTSEFAEPGEAPSPVPSWRDFRVLPVSMTLI